VAFNFPDDRQARDAFEFIRNRTCRVGSIEKLYAFQYTPARQEKGLNGWTLYDARAEFRRQGISEKLSDKGWRISTINKDYSFSPTYPAVMVVPSRISDNVLKYAGTFRSRQRIPALTYYHPVTNATITRSSQPLVGIRFKHNVQDETLVKACFDPSTEFRGERPAAPQASPSSSQAALEAENGTGGETSGQGVDPADDDILTTSTIIVDEDEGPRVFGARRDNLIVDARPAINSLAMQVAGKGSENMEYYKCATKVFLSIDNIHVMRDSLNRVIDAIKDADVSPFPPNRDLLARSSWIKHIQSVLEGSHIIAQQVGVKAAHVLIHCSDGWDRTSQLSALSQIMLDPYFRTIDGFIVLVEKDWLSFGHMFQQRSGHLNHEKWFNIQGDAMAGARIEPGESDGRNEVLDNAISSAKRFFSKNLGQGQEESDADGPAAAEEHNSRQALVPLEENQATRPREISPVFHQFLDATYQLIRQHPTRFEFNERFLRRLLYHLYSCQYGTFLYNNEQQRREAKVQERTRSVWDYFISRRQEFTNQSYDPLVDDNIRGKERLLFPRAQEVRWWHQVFNRTDEDMNAALNAAVLASERVAAYSSGSVTPGLTAQLAGSAPGSQQGSPRRGASPMPPALQSSQSVMAGVESAHALLTPEANPATLNRSASAGDAGAFTVIRDGIAGLGIRERVEGVWGTLGSSASSSGARSADSVPQQDGAASQRSGEQEMREMS